MIRVAICDDDMRFTGYFESLIEQTSSSLGIVSKIEVFFDGETLLKDISSGNRYDLIFMDIDLKRLNGISAARYIREIDRTVLIIYSSGYDQNLKELFEVEPFRFLSKPINKKLFIRYFTEACNRIIMSYNYFQFTFNKVIKKVTIRDILFFESKNRIIIISLNDGSEEQFYGKLNNIEDELIHLHTFLRIHQSYLVNYDYIKKMNFSNITLSCANGKDMCLNISEDRQRQVRQQLFLISKLKDGHI